MRSSPAPAPLKCVIQWGEEEEEKKSPLISPMRTVYFHCLKVFEPHIQTGEIF